MMSRAASASAVSRRAQIRTFTPSRASARAVSRPIPLLPPVTSAVLPASPSSIAPAPFTKIARDRSVTPHMPEKDVGRNPTPTGRFADHQAKAIVAGKSRRQHGKLRETKFREEIEMSLTRRQALEVRRRRHCCKQPSQARNRRKRSDPGRLSAGAHRSVVVHRRRHQSRHPAGGEGNQRCRRHRRAAARTDHPRHPERSDQGGQRRRRAHPRPEGQRRVRPGQFRRVARGRAAAWRAPTRRRSIPAGSTA